jgi:hypothetical protein
LGGRPRQEVNSHGEPCSNSRSRDRVRVPLARFERLGVVDVSLRSGEGLPDRRLKKDARALLGLLAGAAATGLAAALINAAA